MNSLNYILQKTFLIIVSGILLLSVIIAPNANATPWQMIFPVLGGGSYSNDYDAYRSLNGVHHATDIFAPKNTPIVSPVDGYISYVIYPQESWGYSVGIKDDDGFEYKFIHMNNDKPGTDDGSGGGMNAYKYDVKTGNRVVRGQTIGWVGDSGNAENTPPHLHFEIYDQQKQVMNPYWYLKSAQIINYSVMHPQLNGEILPYGPWVNSAPELAYGNLFGDAKKELVVAPSAGSSPNIKVLNDSGTGFISDFMAYDTSFTGGVTIATGDVDNDGIDEIITGTGGGNTSHVKVFKSNGTKVNEFFAYPGYNTGAIVGVGDLDGDGAAEIITGTGPGNNTHVKIFTSTGIEVRSFFAYPTYATGVDIAVGDVGGSTNLPEIITSNGPGVNASDSLKIFNANGTLINAFATYDGFYDGVRVSVGNVDTSTVKSEIVTAPWFNGGPDVKVFAANGSLLKNKSTYENWWSGQYDIAVNGRTVTLGTGGIRRDSFRQINF